MLYNDEEEKKTAHVSSGMKVHLATFTKKKANVQYLSKCT